MLTFSVDP